MYVGKKRQDQLTNLFVIVIYILLFIWSVTANLEAHLDSAIIDANTDYFTNPEIVVFRSEEIEKVTNIKGDGTLVLDNGNEVKSSEIKEYVRVKKGSGTYYVPDTKIMVAEVTFSDVSSILLRSCILHIVVVLSSLLLIVIYKKLYRNPFMAFLYLVYIVYSSYELFYMYKTLAGLDMNGFILILVEGLLYLVVCYLVKKYLSSSKLKIKRT